MNWLDKLIMFLACIVEIFILFDYFKNFFDVKIKKKYVKLLCVGAVVGLFLINNLQSSIVNLIFVPILLWIFVTIIFDVNLAVRFGYFVIAYAVMIGVEFFYIILSETTADMLSRNGLIQVSEYAWQLIFIKFLNYMVFLVLKQTSTKSKKRMTNKLFITYLCVPLATMGMMLAVFYSGVNFDESHFLKIIMTLFFVCMLAGNMLFFYAFQKYTENLNETYQQQIELVYQKAEIERLTQIAGLNDDFNEILHNATHYFKVIGELAYENKNHEICNIIENLNGKMNRGNIYEYSYHKMLNTILSEYNNKAENSGVRFDAYVEPGCVLEHIQDIDLITMLGNILDNAICASSQKDENSSVSVRIFMQKEGKLCIIKVINDFIGELKEEHGKLLSTKKESGIHGVGIASVSRMAEKYGGYWDYYIDDLKFNAVLVLPIPDVVNNIL